MSIIYSISSKVFPRHIRYRLWRRRHWKSFSFRFEDAIQHFVIEKGITDTKEINKIRKELVNAYVRDEWYPDEYFFFNYERLSRKGIHEFVANPEANRFWNFMNTREMYLLTCDKGLTYQYFKPFFHRDLVSVSKDSVDSIKAFQDFTEKHPSFIVKPTFGNLGNGVQRIDVSDKESVESLTQRLIKEYPDGFVAEELIVQCDELAAFHPSSVNTVRITTVRQKNGEVYIIHRSFIRFGTGGRCVDNGGNGGIFGGLDFETGIIKGVIDERMNRYVAHPDSGKTIIGYQIPRWNEAKTLVIDLAKQIPGLNYCGWDLALTDKGWVMVEANGKGLFIGFQMPTQEGFREEFEDLKKRCGYKA